MTIQTALITLAVLVAAYAAWKFARRYLILPLLALAITSGVAWHTVQQFPWQGCRSVFAQGACVTLYGAAHGIGDGLVGFQAWVQKEANGGGRR